MTKCEKQTLHHKLMKYFMQNFQLFTTTWNMH